MGLFWRINGGYFMININKTDALFEYIQVLTDFMNKDCNVDLYTSERISDLKKVGRALSRSLDRGNDKKRKLSVGVIGDIKAGKSTFLNSLLFGGKDILPKSVTPMTAALTKITYSDTPKAIVHFYTHEDWELIEQDSNEFDRIINNEYNTYLENYDIRKSGVNTNIGKPKSKEEFTKSMNYSVEERYKSAKELTDMIRERHTDLNMLGDSKDVRNNLDDYVGANGKYTPIVNYVELQICEESLKEFDIVDTPGLNDPVKSRSLKTKEFLSQCDVAVILSPVGQFLPATTMCNINMRIPSEGIKHIIILGSRMDEGIRQISEDKKQPSFIQAYKLCESEYMDTYHANIEKAKKSGIVGGIKIYGEPIFISSAFFTMYLKKKANQPLSKEENTIIETIKKDYPDFDEEKLGAYSKFGNVIEKLKEIKAEKEKIISEHDREIVDVYSSKAFEIVETLISDTVSRIERLSSCDIKEINTRMDEAAHAIDSTRSKIYGEFNTAGHEVSVKIFQLKAVLQGDISNHTDMRHEKTTTYDRHTVSEGLFGIKKRVYEDEITHFHVAISEVDNNINDYMSECNHKISDELDHLFIKNSMKKRITEIMLNAFAKAGGKFEEDDIIIPLNEVFSRITVPDISLSPYQYIDKIHCEFSSGTADDKEISKLSSLQSRILTSIYEAYANELDRCCKTICEVLKKQAVGFSDELDKRIRGELEILSRQANEKEENLKRYKAFLSELKAIKNKYKDV